MKQQFPVAFLRAHDGTALAKEYKINGGELVKSSYPHVFAFDSEIVQVSTIQEFEKLIKQHASTGACLLKGPLLKDLANESRAGSTDPNMPTQWLCLDIDGLPVANERELLDQIPCLKDVSYVFQASASMGIEPEKGLSAHLFFIMKTAVQPSLLKNWLTHLNLSLSTLKQNIKLSRSHVTLKWPLDITTCQNDKLLYIAPPTITKDVTDSLKGKRIKLVKRQNDVVELDLSNVHPERNAAEKLIVLNQLRKQADLPPRRKEQFKKFGDTEVLKNPGQAQVTGTREGRGFTYLNINGGDSWAYYHPDNNPEILYNFKGEPNYLVKEFLPDYYDQAVKSAGTATGPDVEETGLFWLAFRDKLTDKYYVGKYCWDSRSLDINTVATETRVKHFLKEHGQPLGDFIPTWRYEFDFTSDVEFDPKNRFINRYVRSKYMKNANLECTTIPPMVNKLLNHTFGEFKDYWVNWFAYIVQKRKRTNMAWILTGVQGSGKGVINRHLIEPILGANYVHSLQTLEAFEQQFNKFSASALVVFVNESRISDTNKVSRLVDKVKSQITEPRVSIREMRTDEYMVDNHCSFIFCSNHHDPMRIDTDDRRMMVPTRNAKKLLDNMTYEEINELLPKELYDFTGYLMNYEVREKEVSTPVDTPERRLMQHVSVDSVQAIGEALQRGDIEFFIDNLPEVEDLVIIQKELALNNPPSYRDILMRAANGPQPVPMSRQDLQILFYFASGMEVKHKAPNKFSRLLGHKGIGLETIRIGDGTLRGKYVHWNVSEQIKKLWGAPVEKMRVVK